MSFLGDLLCLSKNKIATYVVQNAFSAVEQCGHHGVILLETFCYIETLYTPEEIVYMCLLSV